MSDAPKCPASQEAGARWEERCGIAVLGISNSRRDARVDRGDLLPGKCLDEVRAVDRDEACRRNRSSPIRETTFSLRSSAGRADYKTDYILAGRLWTPLDDASPKIR